MEAVEATPRVEDAIESSDSSGKQPLIKKRRTGQHKKHTRSTPALFSAGVVGVDHGGSSEGGKSIPDWISKAVTAENTKGSVRTREKRKIPAQRKLTPVV